MNLKAEVLTKKHVRKEFYCGNEQLDNYLKKQARQDMLKKLSACFVLTENSWELSLVKGYYTLSNTSISQDLIPDGFRRKFPRTYQNIPATLLGRLARDISVVKSGMGETLLLDALLRAYMTSDIIGSFAVIVDPIDEKAEKFYSEYGFIKLPDSGKMFLAMKTIKQLFEQSF